MLCGTSGKGARTGPFCAAKGEIGGFDRHKFLESRHLALSKAPSHWYIPPATPGHCQGLPSQEASGPDRRATRALVQDVSAPGFFGQGAQRFIAGWSSPVARQAHNLKVIGSNPIPATKIKPGRSGTPPFLPGVFVCDGQRPPSSARRKIVDRNAAPQGDREGEFQLAREDDRAVIGLGALQEVADFNVRIAVV